MFCYSYPLYSNYYDNFSLTIYIHIGWCQTLTVRNWDIVTIIKIENSYIALPPDHARKHIIMLFSLYYIFYFSHFLLNSTTQYCFEITCNLEWKQTKGKCANGSIKRSICTLIYAYRKSMITNIFSFVRVLHFSKL